MATAEIVTVGTELLLGHLVDTNAAEIARSLAGAGIDVHRQTAVGDNVARIAQAVREALDRADALICTGGLGPTVDDMTREGIAAATDRPLELHAPSLDAIQARFMRFGRPMTDNNRRQAMFPRGSDVLENPRGSAPGFIVDDGVRVIVALPGVPSEMRGMLVDRVIPFLKQRFSVDAAILTRVLHTIGCTESELDERIADLFREGVNPSIAVLAHSGQIDVKITAKAQTREEASSMIADLEPIVRERLGDVVYGVDAETLPRAMGAALRERGWTLAVAESCTGGMLGEMITSEPGSSKYFLGGVIAYDDRAKMKQLDVAADLMERFGAVSEEVCAAMAEGVRTAMRSDVALSITGVAGPGGGTGSKPVGLVYVGLAAPLAPIEIRKLDIPGDRELVRHRASLAALSMTWRAARIELERPSSDERS